jgi:hypothetical protein
MPAKIINIHTPSRAGRILNTVPKERSDWLVPWLKAKGLASDMRTVWDAWPPLETASLKLARLFGEGLKGHDGNSVVGMVVSRALLAFRTKKGSGAPNDRAARIYLETLLECGELIVTNRVEAGAPDGSGEVHVWDPSIGRYDVWCDMQPSHYVITTHCIRADDGEYAAGRSMIAALIMSAAEYSRIFYGPSESTWNQQ